MKTTERLLCVYQKNRRKLFVGANGVQTSIPKKLLIGDENFCQKYLSIDGGKNSMKKILFIVLMIGIAVSAVGCFQHHDISLTLKVCGSFAVPGMYCSDLKGQESTVKQLEEDSQGRILFEYCTKNVITKQEETAIVIMQKYDNKNVFFYENNCFVLVNDQETDLESLKQKNDWGAPLDENKLARRSYRITLDLFLAFDTSIETNRALDKAVQVIDSDAKRIGSCILDVSEKGSELFWIELQKEELTSQYLFIVSPSYEIVWIEIAEASSYLNDLMAFKQQHW